LGNLAGIGHDLGIGKQGVTGRQYVELVAELKG
jgi:hypothetical protein